MFLKLRYWWYTDKKTRESDMREYDVLRNALWAKYRDMQIARKDITGTLGEYNEYCCFKRGDEGYEYKCGQLRRADNTCVADSCPGKSKNINFCNALQEYNAQKRLVNEFWEHRMSMRVK